MEVSDILWQLWWPQMGNMRYEDEIAKNGMITTMKSNRCRSEALPKGRRFGTHWHVLVCIYIYIFIYIYSYIYIFIWIYIYNMNIYIYIFMIPKLSTIPKLCFIICMMDLIYLGKLYRPRCSLSLEWWLGFGKLSQDNELFRLATYYNVQTVYYRWMFCMSPINGPSIP